MRPVTPKSKYTLHTPNGFYDAESLVGVLWAVFAHRLSHLLGGDGWND